MKDQFIMGETGNVAIAVPLFRVEQVAGSEIPDSYVMAFSTDKPVAYAVDIGGDKFELISATWLEEHCFFIGEV